jgi:hypothetical protein
MSRINRPSFGIGLTLAGAVSAGAYTAGVIDFLIEALDAWSEQKDRPDALHHDVELSVLSGASAGAMTAAIAAVALQSCIKPARYAQKPPDLADNRLYDAWVRQIDIRRLLSLDDLRNDRPVLSLLNSADLQSIAKDALRTNGPHSQRTYVADPLPVFLTVANLRGVPYGFGIFQNGLYRMQNHMDDMRFAVGHKDNEIPGTVALDVDGLFSSTTAPREWETFTLAALASGAFPVGLAAQRLSRSPCDYQPCCCELLTKQPAWNGAAPDPYDFVSVDGGLMNNEPLQLARNYLAGGADQQNPRFGLKADRAVILIDPFPNVQPFEPRYQPDASLVGVIVQMFSALTGQARFHAMDLELAADENVYSRFAIYPNRIDDQGNALDPAISSAQLGGFGGFFKEEFRQHDFHLGRRNCQAFLKRHFYLPDSNPLFAMDNDNTELISRYRMTDRGGSVISRIVGQPGQPLCSEGKNGHRAAEGGEEHYLLPIIPLVPPLDQELPQPRWPEGLSDREFDEIEGRVKGRVKRLGNRLIETELVKLLGDGLVTKSVNLAWSALLARRASHRVMNALKQSLMAPSR